jgi:hypothetical protein
MDPAIFVSDLQDVNKIQKVRSKKTMKKKYFLLASYQPLTKQAEYVSQWYGSVDPYP